MSNKIIIIDYGMGNVKSVLNAVKFLGAEATITQEKKDIDAAEHIIIPGVGAFGDAINNFKKRNLINLLNDKVLVKKTPCLGLCLGMQLFSNTSTEYGCHDGLGWIEGDVKKIPKKDETIKIPHVGWNDILIRKKHPVLSNMNSNYPSFYFVHSYYFDAKHPTNIYAECEHGITFPVVIIKNNIIGMQFHPEKSQDNGLQLLKNFIDWKY